MCYHVLPDIDTVISKEAAVGYIVAICREYGVTSVKNYNLDTTVRILNLIDIAIKCQ
jgi:hypothetical protein